MIYKTEKLTEFQKKVNKASYVLCKNKPSLLFSKKGDLLATAQKKVHDEGFVYKKGHSRSKRHGLGNEITVDSQPKRAKVCADERQGRMKDIAAETKDLDTHITLKKGGSNKLLK